MIEQIPISRTIPVNFSLKKYFRFIENFISFSLIKAIDAVIPLIIIPYLISVVGTKNYGIYAFAFALVFYLMNIIQYGFTLSAVRLIATNRDDKNELNQIYNKVFTTQIYLTIAVLLLLAGLVVFIDIFNRDYIIYLFFVILIIGELMTPIWFFLGVEKMRYITMINLLSKSTFAVLTFIFIQKESDYIFISLFQSIGYIISGIAAQIIIFKSFKLSFYIAKITDVKYMLKDGISAFLTLITPTIYTNTSIFLIGFFGVPQYVSYMQIGSKVSGAFSVLNTILTNIFFPILNRNKGIFNKVKYIFLSMGFLLSLIMFFCSEYLISLWIQEDYSEIVLVVKLLSPTPLLSSIISIFGVNGLLIHKKDRLYMIIVAIGSISGLLSALILIPKYFYIGGAISIVTALSIKAVLSFIYNNRVVKELIEPNEI
ncbi:oligosaccharide flippase family protein [uncultured Gelidibacter sp.]|uniref:oligosaccharide flippase family protein n=1 Tax=uncultured Gelidibacter sp. TaxID=259318 RepID=UPI00262DF7DF|nr:oligosaccharide flippase family protein [uncultured Gelidibacter sp.]